MLNTSYPSQNTVKKCSPGELVEIIFPIRLLYEIMVCKENEKQTPIEKPSHPR